MTDGFFGKLAASADVLNQRGFVGGLYLTCMILPLFILPTPLAQPDNWYLALIPIVLGLAMIVAHLSYEICLPWLRSRSSVSVLKGFHDTVQGVGDSSSFDYSRLRRWRHEFLASEASGHYKSLIETSMSLRQTATYLLSTAATGTVVPVVGGLFFDGRRRVAVIELVLSGFVLVAAGLGHRSRSYILGQSIGHAFLHRLDRQGDRASTSEVPANKGMQTDAQKNARD
jgi:hypothetical protein